MVLRSLPYPLNRHRKHDMGTYFPDRYPFAMPYRSIYVFRCRHFLNLGADSDATLLSDDKLAFQSRYRSQSQQKTSHQASFGAGADLARGAQKLN
eukprot:4647732-Amphidinium_carterae.1